MNYNREEWQVGDFIVALVTRSREIKAGVYVYELAVQSDNERRWLIRSRVANSVCTKWESNTQKFGVPHAIADQHMERVCTGIVRLLPDCPCCEEVRNAYHITSDHI